MTNYAVVGLGFGDEGKGGCVDYLCRTRDVSLVVRHNGGAQAGHNVVTEDGRHHEFSQWGSGTLASVPTYLSRFMVVDPLALEPEADHLREIGVEDPWSMLYIDPQALVVTPYHRGLQRLRELVRGDGRHGTCGIGFGEAVRQSIEEPGISLRWEDLRWTTQARLKLERAKIWCARGYGGDGDSEDALTLLYENPHDVAQEMATVAERVGDLVPILDEGLMFEGAQGVLLDQDHGFHPNTTWSRTTFANADTLSDEAGIPRPRRIGVTRAYGYRHGPGPFPTEDATWKPASEPHNAWDEHRGPPRYGALDLVLLKYAIDCCGGIDELAITHLDATFPDPVLSLDGLTGTTWGIPAPTTTNRNRQEALGTWLRHAWPRDRAQWEVEYGLATFLGINHVIKAYGPTAADRHEVALTESTKGYL